MSPHTMIKLLSERVEQLSKELNAALSQAEADRVDAERYRWIEDNATSCGGGNGFTLQVFVPHDMEDWGCAIDVARLTKSVKTEG